MEKLACESTQDARTWLNRRDALFPIVDAARTSIGTSQALARLENALGALRPRRTVLSRTERPAPAMLSFPQEIVERT
jgi:hypothetical protein